MKKHSFTIILSTFVLLLTSCASQPSDALLKTVNSPAPSPIAATPVPSPIADPTATPFIPLTLEEVEAKLEKQLNENVEFIGETELGNTKLFRFRNETGDYLTDTETGDIRLFTSNIANNNPEELLDEEGAKQVAIDELMKHCPEFFDYDYYLNMHKPHETVYGFYFYQLSDKGRHTGNLVNANIVYDGTTRAFSIFNNEDPSAVDADYKISEEAAIELAYEAAEKEFSYLSEEDKNNYFLDRTDHNIEIYMNCHNGIQQWMIEVLNFDNHNTESMENLQIIIEFSATVDANTGEILFYSGIC